MRSLNLKGKMMSEQVLKTTSKTTDPKKPKPWISPTFERVNLKDAMSNPGSRGADGGGFPNVYTS
jgi:hypothetical protein